MKYYHKIDIPNFEKIKKSVLKICEDHELLDNHGMHEFQPENPYKREIFDELVKLNDLNRWLKDLQWDSHFDGFIINVMKPNTTLEIHIDPILPHINRYRILMPIIGCENTPLYYWKANADPEIWDITTRCGKHFDIQIFKDEDCTLVDSIKLDAPYIIDTFVPHSASNAIDNNIRINFWINFKSTLDLSYFFK